MENPEEMDKFLHLLNLSRLSHENIGNVNRPMTNNETETAIKSLPTGRSIGSDGFTDKFYKPFKEVIPKLFRLFQNIEQDEILPNFFISPALL